MFIYIDMGEEWLPIHINGKLTNYEVSSYGRVRNRHTYELLKQRKHRLSKKDKRYIKDPENVYMYVNLSINGKTKRYYVHRLMLYEFHWVEGCEKLEVNHDDGIKYHNHLSNLDWCTRSENQKHAYRTGLKRDIHGEDRPKAKYKNKDIIEMCELMKAGFSNKYITEKFNITDDDLLSDIRNKRRWGCCNKRI